MSVAPDRPLSTTSSPRPRVQSAARAMAIMLAVSQSTAGLTTKEISDRLGIQRQAVYHLLHTLVGAGMLTRDDRNRYLLGIRVGTLAEGFKRQLSPSEHLGPIVRALAESTGETAYASGWWSGEIMTLVVTRGTNPVQAAEVPQGYVGAAHTRAAGKLLLAFADRDALEAYLETHPLDEPGRRASLDAELESIRAQGYAFDEEGFASGLCCLSVPFDGGRSPFVLTVSAPLDRFKRGRARYLEAMRDTVATLDAES
jgi:IclR family acetate operon transcriptional repressor